jgi:hypothetical protein
MKMTRNRRDTNAARMKRAAVLLVALGGLSILSSKPAAACSCFHIEYSRKEIRKHLKDAWAYAKNIVLVRGVESTVSEKGDRERAILVVVRVWKGAYKVGDKIHSDTSEIGGGMCGSPVPVGEFPLFFNDEPVTINGCPGSFELSAVEESELNRLQAKESKKSR